MESFARNELEMIADRLLPREYDFVHLTEQARVLYQKVMRMIDKLDAKKELESLRGYSVKVEMDREQD